MGRRRFREIQCPISMGEAHGELANGEHAGFEHKLVREKGRLVLWVKELHLQN